MNGNDCVHTDQRLENILKDAVSAVDKSRRRNKYNKDTSGYFQVQKVEQQEAA